eukprot:COSAG06_NODE_3781_length_4914_cov_1.283697_2_plen_107_part_00
MPVRESGPVSDRPPCSAAVLALRALRAAARASARGCICTGFVSAPAPAPRPARLRLPLLRLPFHFFSFLTKNCRSWALRENYSLKQLGSLALQNRLRILIGIKKKH